MAIPTHWEGLVQSGRNRVDIVSRAPKLVARCSKSMHIRRVAHNLQIGSKSGRRDVDFPVQSHGNVGLATFYANRVEIGSGAHGFRSAKIAGPTEFCRQPCANPSQIANDPSDNIILLPAAQPQNLSGAAAWLEFPDSIVRGGWQSV